MSIVCGRSAMCLRRNHVQLAIEYVSPVHLRKLHPHEFIYRMDEMLDLAKDAGPNAGLDARFVALASCGRHRAGYSGGRQGPHRLRASGRRAEVAADQIKDSERLMPGEGIIDFTAFFGALKKIGYNGGVSPEIFGRGLKDIPPEEGAKLGLKTTTEVMKRAQSVVIRTTALLVLAVAVCPAQTADTKLAEAYWEWERTVPPSPSEDEAYLVTKPS